MIDCSRSKMVSYDTSQRGDTLPGTMSDELVKWIQNIAREAIDDNRYTFYRDKEKNRKTLVGLQYTADEMVAAVKELQVCDYTEKLFDERDNTYKYVFHNELEGRRMYYRYYIEQIEDDDWLVIESAHFDRML